MRPNLKVIVHNKFSTVASDVKKALKKLNAEVINYAFEEKDFSPDRLRKELDMEEFDIDLTFIDEYSELWPLRFEYYETLAAEILDQNPDYCFVPVGSGLLLENILHKAKDEIQAKGNGACFFAEAQKIKNCTFYGSRAAKSDTITLLDKLYAKYTEPNINLDLYKGEYCNRKTAIVDVRDNYVRKAIKLTGISERNLRLSRRNEYQINEHFVIAEPSGLAGLALFLQLEDSIPKDSKIVIVNYGRLKLEKILYAEKSEINDFYTIKNKFD